MLTEGWHYASLGALRLSWSARAACCLGSLRGSGKEYSGLMTSSMVHLKKSAKAWRVARWLLSQLSTRW